MSSTPSTFTILKNAVIESKPAIALGVITIFVGVMLFTIFDNPSALNTKTYAYLFSILIPIAITGLLLYKINTFGGKAIAIIISVCVLLFGILYAYSIMDSSYYSVVNYMLNIILFLSIAVGLAILYNFLKNNLNKVEGQLGLVLNIVFFIPCMINDFISFLMQQYNLTPNIVFVLFVIEIILILSYIYLPRLFKKILLPKQLILQNEPLFLDKRVEISNSKKIYPNIDKKKSSDLLNSHEPPYSTNYCLSMWIYMNPQNTSNAAYANETEIFNYNDKTGKNPKPRITYSYDPVTGLDKYHIYFTAIDDPIIITIIGQKWNQFVFNYNNNMVDVFINGNLERSYQMKHFPKYDNSDTITVGAANGLYGAICNISYNNSPLTKYEIVNSYNLLMNNNPPINVE